VLPPPLLPSHHQVPKTQLPKLVVAILGSLYLIVDTSIRWIRSGRIIPASLLSTLVVTIDKQSFVPSLPLFISWMMMIALPMKGLRQDQLCVVKREETWNLSWEPISTTHQKGVKRDTNLMRDPDSLLLDNPNGSMASPEVWSLEKWEWQ